jgi:hypothetical protein
MDSFALTRRPTPLAGHLLPLILALLALVPVAARAQIAAEPIPACTRVIRADVVALDQVFYWNRLGAVQPQGMIYALERDVVHVNQNEGSCSAPQLDLVEGQVRLRRGKRPRPLVLRANLGDCIDVHFRNLLAPMKVDEEQPATREASVHVVGLHYRVEPEDGGMWIGDDPSGLVLPGGSRVYRLYAQREGTFLLYSGGAMVGGEGDGGSISAGLFGAVNVQPRGARYFRSQVTEKDLRLATTAIDPQGFPTINYTATYQNALDPDQCWRRGSPILEMTQNGRIVHSDLTAIITGPNLGAFNNFDYPLDNPVYAEERRNEPYRELTVIFHDETGAVQAFPHFKDEILSHTLHSVRDAFAINYGTGGIGAEILANRLQVGPMFDCLDCKYEEFFLTSWVVGDPAMVVDKPANDPCGDSPLEWDHLRHGIHTQCQIPPGPKATKALYPDDPSNTYHSYMNDHLKFRNLHAGTDDHHIFHLHAHQWEHTPKSNRSSYMDSQAIGQGTSFTYEVAFEGSGNRPKTVGDSIFHCHFYPHFAQGMWGLWRVHDTLELGTVLDEDGRPFHEQVDKETVITQTRALPDDEIEVGTPIPALVPIPGKSLPPPPTPVRLVNGQIDTVFTTSQAQAAKAAGSPFFNPGYPFFIPGIAGRRPPHPPLDFALDGNGDPLDGGLPRHVVLSGQGNPAFFDEAHDRLDFHKHVLEMDALNLPEAGTALEQLAMETHGVRDFNNPTANTVPPAYPYQHNGGKPQQGAPFADPCLTDRWLSDWNGVREPVPNTRRYQSADIELDVVLNKAGWHFPQQRMSVLVDDVQATVNGTRPPEPLFFRANSRDCVVFEMTNLVPYEYQVDDFQVRSPTDILGQHIHLVKFDVTSSDGAANGFNYEDGSLSPEEVQERIEALRIFNQCDEQGIEELTVHPDTGHLFCPVPEDDPRFSFLSGNDKNCNGFDDVLGAQTTVQRWWADPIEDETGFDRTLQTVFTHDHFGPSTHQQAGLYAGLVVEREGSVWFANEGSTVLGNRYDGGPTTWAARIDPPDEDSFREFMIEFADFQLAYERNEVWKSCPDPKIGWADPDRAINPPGRRSPGPPFLYLKPLVCPTNPDDWDFTLLASNDISPPCPEAVSADDPGFISVNYRSEPLAFRISDTFDPGQTPQQVQGLPGDLSFAYASRLPSGALRANSEMDKVPDQTLAHVPYPALTGGLFAGDPFTPLLRAYEGDEVHIKVLSGAHEEEHDFSIHGNHWLFEPYDVNSGFRASQMLGISEYFQMLLAPTPEILEPDEVVDYLYKPSSAAEWQWSGAWGLLRMYQGLQPDLPPLPDNSDGRFGSPGLFDGPVEREAFFDEAPADELEPLPIPASELQSSGETEAVLAELLQPGNRPIACPRGAPRRSYEITAVAAREALPSVGTVGRSLVYNPRPDPVGNKQGPLHDPTAILFVEKADLNHVGGRPRLKPGAPVEPIILRAEAGECVRVTLRNELPGDGITPVPFAFDLPGWSGWHMIIELFNANQVAPSSEVGLRPQLVHIDPREGDGTNVGMNPFFHGKQTVAPGEKVTYYWYAGEVLEGPGGGAQARPVEFGSTGLASSDPLEHSQKGAVGALVIEPDDATWTLLDTHPYLLNEADRRTRAEALVTPPTGDPFRELVIVVQDDINLRYDDGSVVVDEPVENLAVNEDPTESGQKAFNYRTEPIWFRMGHRPGTKPKLTRDFQFADALTDAEVGGDPVTHIFDAAPGRDVRFRLVHPGGHTQSHALEVQGHNWPELPFVQASSRLGLRPASEWQGARHGVGPTCHYDQLIPAAGGPFKVEAKYLYRDYVAWGFDGGIWGIFWVHPEPNP